MRATLSFVPDTGSIRISERHTDDPLGGVLMSALLLQLRSHTSWEGSLDDLAVAAATLLGTQTWQGQMLRSPSRSVVVDYRSAGLISPAIRKRYPPHQRQTKRVKHLRCFPRITSGGIRDSPEAATGFEPTTRILCPAFARRDADCEKRTLGHDPDSSADHRKALRVHARIGALARQNHGLSCKS